MEVGRVILGSFFAGDPKAYLSRDPHKATSFYNFVQLHAADLADLGLGEQTLRHCVLTHIVVSTLPPGLAAELGFSKLVELTRVPDPTMRARLAQAAVQQRWSLSDLKQQVARAKDGLVYDTDPDQPGLQLPAPTEPEDKASTPGRVAQRVQAWSNRADELTEALTALRGTTLTTTQREKLQAALASAEAKLAGLRAALQGA